MSVYFAGVLAVAMVLTPMIRRCNVSAVVVEIVWIFYEASLNFYAQWIAKTHRSHCIH